VACEGAVAEPPSPYGVALGLAMAAASPGAFALRLVPERVRRRRHFRRKGVFAWAAGALAALVLLTSVVGTVHNWRASRRQVAMLEQGIEAAAADEARCQEARRDLDELRHKISLLADRVRANAFALRTLDALRRHTPAAIRIRSAQIAPEPPRGRAAGRPPQRLAFHLKGVATKRGALDASQELDEFVRRLAGPPIGAKPLRQTRLATPVGDRVDFELVFSPSASLIEE